MDRMYPYRIIRLTRDAHLDLSSGKSSSHLRDEIGDNRLRVVRILLIGFLSLSTLFGQDLKTKKERLEQIQEQIEKERESIEKQEKLKKNALDDIQDYSSKVKGTQKTLKSLINSLQEKTGELKKTSSRLQDAEYLERQLKGLCREEFLRLFFLEYSPGIDRYGDRFMISRMINQTVDTIRDAESDVRQLSSAKGKLEKEVKTTTSKRQQSEKEEKQLSGKIQQLNEKVKMYDIKKSESEEALSQLSKEAEQLEDLIAKLEYVTEKDDYTYEFASGRIAWPGRGKVVRSFGEYKANAGKFHSNGIDIELPEGSKVVAAEEGVVVFAEWYESAGKTIIIDHQNGFLTTYSHNGKILVTKGDHVRRGDEIAQSGNVIHFELRKRRIPVDPMQYLEKQ